MCPLPRKNAVRKCVISGAVKLLEQMWLQPADVSLSRMLNRNMQGDKYPRHKDAGHRATKSSVARNLLHVIVNTRANVEEQS
jgi:hypothetical protein